MKALIGCERSGVVREAMRRAGIDAYSCDLADAEDGSRHHIRGELLEVLGDIGAEQDIVIVHPDCTYLSASGLHWNRRRPDRAQKTEVALAFVEALMQWALRHPVRFCLENPHGCIGTRLPALDRHFAKQTIQPYDFGEDASKATVLRLRNLPPLAPTQRVRGRIVESPRGSGRMVERWSNQTDNGQNRLGPSEDRWMKRSRTYPGIATAMAEQWKEFRLS